VERGVSQQADRKLGSARLQAQIIEMHDLQIDDLRLANE